MRCLKYITLVLTIAYNSVHSAKILGIFPTPSVSHQVVFQPIWKELSLRGHQVTVITPNPLKDPALKNLTEIDVSYMYGIFEDLSDSFSAAPNHWGMLQLMSSFPKLCMEQFFVHPQVLSLINDTAQEFDLVMGEYLWTFVSAFAHKFNCPLIGVASLGVFATVYELLGNPVHPVLYPELLASCSDQLSFFERVDSVLFTMCYRYNYYTYSHPLVDNLLKKHFGEDIPKLKDMEGNVSMLFLNTNPIIHKPRPYLPNIIEMGRMHIKPKKPLPKDLKDYLDSAEEGVIYFSLGSNVKSIHIDKEKRKFIKETFSELPCKVLWKFEDDRMEDKPDNVKISKWLPQQDLLGHPNIKLFITQAGLQSTEEAILNKVPLIGMPFMADQYYNAKRYETLGIGKHLDFATLTKDQFKDAILEVMENPRYKEKVSEVADIFMDEPESGLERAVWWTEYVIRHKGAPYFKSPALDMPWYQYYLLDVISLFLAVIFLSSYLAYISVKYVKNSFCRFVLNKKSKVL